MNRKQRRSANKYALRSKEDKTYATTKLILELPASLTDYIKSLADHFGISISDAVMCMLTGASLILSDNAPASVVFDFFVQLSVKNKTSNMTPEEKLAIDKIMENLSESERNEMVSAVERFNTGTSSTGGIVERSRELLNFKNFELKKGK